MSYSPFNMGLPETRSSPNTSPTYPNNPWCTAQPSSYQSSDSNSKARHGNNIWGSQGTYKCAACRHRRKKCIYDALQPDVPCKLCASQGLTGCIKELASKPEDDGQYNGQLGNEASIMSPSVSPTAFGTIEWSSFPQTDASSSNGGSSHGNNSLGLTGSYKCDACRQRRRKCVYTTLESPCNYCTQNNRDGCIKKLPSQRREAQVESAEFTRLSEMANHYESIYPHLSAREILSYVTLAIEQQEQEQGQGQGQEEQQQQQQQPHPETIQQEPDPYMTYPMNYNPYGSETQDQSNDTVYNDHSSFWWSIG